MAIQDYKSLIMRGICSHQKLPFLSHLMKVLLLRPALQLLCYYQGLQVPIIHTLFYNNKLDSSLQPLLKPFLQILIFHQICMALSSIKSVLLDFSIFILEMASNKYTLMLHKLGSLL